MQDLANAAMSTSGVALSGMGTYQDAENAAMDTFGDCPDRSGDDNTDEMDREHDDTDNDMGHDDHGDNTVGHGPPPNPHPEVAIDPDVDIESIEESIEGKGHVKWRDTREQLFRNDDRPPNVVFNEGFKPPNDYNTDLDSYVNENEPSVFVGTTSNVDFASKWGGKYVYDIDAPGGIDVNESFYDSPYEHEGEIAFPGGIKPEYIKGAWEVKPDGSLGKYIPNKNYKG
ncbi:hypothetical protein ABT160_33320 [Streptomyces sp. NPDC001941]|uniref:scabin-related ADP-ribosyltransferase n=1 Tax=Streptomyces sp. NPDC001941 TaxID=3154659 RepID=UPI00331A05D4